MKLLIGEKRLILLGLNLLLCQTIRDRNDLKMGTKSRKNLNKQVFECRRLHKMFGGDGKTWWEREK